MFYVSHGSGGNGSRLLRLENVGHGSIQILQVCDSSNNMYNNNIIIITIMMCIQYYVPKVSGGTLTKDFND